MERSTENIIELMEFEPGTGKRPPPQATHNRRHALTSNHLYTYSLIIVTAVLGLTLLIVTGVIIFIINA